MNTPVAARPDWLRWLVLVSLTLNLMLASALVALAWRVERAERAIEAPLPSASNGPWRELMRREFQKQRRVWIPDLRAARQARIEVADALRAEPFEVDRLKLALAALREADGRLQSRTQNALAELAAEMTPEDRERLARRMERASPVRRP